MDTVRSASDQSNMVGVHLLNGWRVHHRVRRQVATLHRRKQEHFRNTRLCAKVHQPCVGVSAEDLAQVAGEDESIAEILVNATYNDPNGIESVQDAVGESTDLPSLSQMFVSIIGGDEAGVDLLVQVIAVSDELVNILDQTFKEDPDLNLK